MQLLRCDENKTYSFIKVWSAALSITIAKQQEIVALSRAIIQPGVNNYWKIDFLF